MPVIAFVMQTFYGDQIGGAERQVQLLAEALRDRGWKTAYVSERPRGKPAREVLNGMDVLALPVRKKRWALLNYRRLRMALEQSGADLFYQRVRHPYTGMTARCAKNLRKPFVWAAASMADVIRERDLRYESQSPALLDASLHPIIRQIEDWGLRQADAIIVQTEEQGQKLTASYGLQGTVIPNHIVVSQTMGSAKSQPPVVLWISNIKPFKRPELFVNLAERCADLEVRFIMAGSCADASVRQKLEKVQRRLPNFNYVGPLDPVIAEERIAGATLLVNTSLFEGFPNAFQQAWMYGVPTLSLGVDPDGVIGKEGSGAVMQTPEEMELRLRDLLKDQERLSEIGRRAQDFARKNYDLSSLLPRYIELFERLIRA